LGTRLVKALRPARHERRELILILAAGIARQCRVQMLWEIKQLRSPHLSRLADSMLRFGQLE